MALCRNCRRSLVAHQCKRTVLIPLDGDEDDWRIESCECEPCAEDRKLLAALGADVTGAFAEEPALELE